MKIIRDINFYKEIQFESKNDTDLFINNNDINKVERTLNICELLALGNEFDDKFIIPYYQRNLIWTKEQKENFIKSIFNRNNLGTMIFKKAKVGGHLEWSIVDGLQRYTTIKEFIECKFKVYESTFDELSYNDKLSFITTNVVIEEYQYLDEKAELNLYITKNFGGTAHTIEELEKLKRLDKHII